MLKEIWSSISGYVITSVVIILTIMALFYFLKNTTSVMFQGMLDQYLEKSKIEFQLKMEEKNKEIQLRDKQLIELSIKLNESQSEYYKTKSDLDALKRRVISINEPKDLAEIKTRLRNMHYNIR